MLDRNMLFTTVIGLSIVNGLFSPYLAIAVQVVPALMPELFPKTVGWMLFFSSLFVSSATLLGSGVPAALYERMMDASEESTGSMWVWLTAAVLMSLPALSNIG